MIRAAIALAAMTFALVAGAVKMDAPDGNSALDVRLKKLETELRCLVCQNQTLADSDADLAGDLRREVRGLAVAGKSDDQIRDYLVARYGYFVLYDPPLKRTTTLLWIGPFAMLALGALLWWLLLRRRAKTLVGMSTPHDPKAQARARARLDGDDDDTLEE